jgi:pimeloyl-ACP methyl ester carboxylesterase
MSIVDTSHGPVFYTDDGDGPPILLLHAALHDSTDFDQVRESLLRNRRVIAMDWPCHGRSPSPAHTLGAPEFGDLAIEFADKLDLTDLVVIGNSVGGYAASRLAIERPDRVAGVVLVNPGGFTDHSASTRAFCSLMGRESVVRRVFPLFVRAYMRTSNAADEAIVGRVVARARSDRGARTAAALWRSFTDERHNLLPRAADIGVPVLITWGTRDVTAPRRWGERVHAAIAGSRFETFPTGHVVFSSQPEEWLAAVLPFVDNAHLVCHQHD